MTTMDEYNSIEILSDDEDLPSDSDEAEDMDPSRCVTPLSTAKAEITPKSRKTLLNNDQVQSGSTINLMGPDSSFSPASSDKTASSSSTAVDNRSGRHRARKSQHQTLRMSPTDCQFETEGAPPPTKQLVLEKDSAASSKGKTNQFFANFVNSAEMQDLIKTIANERVRCNFLLATYQLPDMNFALNTSMNTLRFQLKERLKQRQDRAKVSPCPTAAATSAASKTNMKGIVRARQPQ
ncbi:uncharacterized protein [Drosophila bipectinata]|uniref:uncharacterized protein n=1 Tax=Drosophila bipectinata TaxID=42026 RepID=UPI001C8A4403|nr:uncharacterized protein LOC108119010 [Drosophila bipectinata]